MRPQKDDLVDRCKVEAWQHVEPKHTKRSIAFLCFELNQQSALNTPRQLKSCVIIDINNTPPERSVLLVSMPPGKYLFSFRTQKSSLVGAIILLCGKLARRQFMIKLREIGVFSRCMLQ